MSLNRLKSPADYASLCDPNYKIPPHIRLLSDTLTDLANPNHELNRLIVQMPPRHGKALPTYALIPLTDGTLKPHGELQPGDQIYDHQGLPTTVTSVTQPHPPTSNPISVKFDNGTSSLCDPLHEWTVETYSNTKHKRVTTTLEARELQRHISRDFKPPRIPLTPTHPPNPTTPAYPPYLEGLFAGDGCVRDGSLCGLVTDLHFYKTQLPDDTQRLKPRKATPHIGDLKTSIPPKTPKLLPKGFLNYSLPGS